MLTRRRGIGFKLEAVEGTAETITAADMILCRNVQWNPDTPTLEKNHHQATLSTEAGVAGRTLARVSFEVLMYGAASAGTAPFWSKLRQACGESETIVASTSSENKPATTSLKSATIKVFLDGISHRLKGARGDYSVTYPPGEVPFYAFTFTGLWDPDNDADASKDEALLVGNAFPAFEPKVFKAALFRIGGTYRGIVRALSRSVNNVIEAVPDGNVTSFKRIDITGRDPSGEFDVEAVTRATYDLEDKVRKKTLVEITCYTGADDSGASGTGSLNAMTDSTKNWPTDRWNGYKLRDSAGNVFAITANSGTALTVSGTPATGYYIIYEAGKLIIDTWPKCELQNKTDKATGGIYDFGIPFKIRMNAGDDEHSTLVV